MTSFEAFKKYRELDPKATLLADDNNAYLFDIYVGLSSDLGVKAYSANDHLTAYDNFKKALVVHDYIFSNNIYGAQNYKFTAIDTMLTLYTGVAGFDVKKEDEAVVYYKKLTDANLSDSQFLSVYQTLAEYYKNKKDMAGFNDIIAKGVKLFPASEYWAAIETENALDGLGKAAYFAKYAEMQAKYPKSYILAHNYAVALYNFLNKPDDASITNLEPYKTQLIDILNKTLAIKATSEDNYMAANFLYNNSIDVSEEARKLRGPKPDDLKRKKELEAKSNAQMNQAIPYAEAVVNLFPSIAKPRYAEKANMKQALNMLKSIYEVKKDAAKVALYTQKLKEAE